MTDFALTMLAAAMWAAVSSVPSSRLGFFEGYPRPIAFLVSCGLVGIGISILLAHGRIS